MHPSMSPARATAGGTFAASDLGATWRSAAECRGTDPEVFFDPVLRRKARAVCRRCPVQGECLDYARSTHEPVGIWGGLSPTERCKGDRRDAEGRRSATPGPVRVIGDDRLKSLFAAADPDRPAIDALRAKVDLSHSAA